MTSDLRRRHLVNAYFPGYNAAVATSENGRPYHHGDLRRVLLEEAVASLRESGPAALSLRDLARRAGVSHAAPAHHFGDKRGLLTAVAAEGFRRLAASLGATYEATRDFAEVGVAYVTFAVEERPYFDVMFRPDLYDPDDPELVAARSASGAALYGPAATVSDAPLEAGIAAWSLVHGLATLGLAGNLPPEVGGDLPAAARQVAGYLFRAPARDEAPQHPPKTKKKKKK
jgi:AcrR family transcriptional regulator